MVSNETITVNATDVTGQRRVSLQTRRDQTIDELTEQIRSKMRLHSEDSDGRQVAYDLRHEGRATGLAPSQIVGEALHDQDTVRVQPKICAGHQQKT